MLKELFRTQPPSRHFTDEEAASIVEVLKTVAPGQAENLFRGQQNAVVLQPLLRCVFALAEHVNRLEARVAELEGKE